MKLRNKFSTRVWGTGFGLAGGLIGLAGCMEPSGGVKPAAVASGTPSSGSKAPVVVPKGASFAISPAAASSVMNLGTEQVISFTVTAAASFAGPVALSIDDRDLRVRDAAQAIVGTVTPAQLTLAKGQSAPVSVRLAAAASAPSLVSGVNLVATEVGPASPFRATSAVPFEVKPIYEIGLMGGIKPETWSAASTVSFATHPGGITVRFVNHDAMDHEVHSSGPIPHMQNVLQKAAGGKPVGVYEVKVTTQAKANDTYYCHLHEGGGQAHTLVFNAFAAAPAIPPSNNPNATFTYVNRNILTPKCVGCHGTSGGYSFASYAETLKSVVPTQPNSSNFYYAISAAGMMPLNGTKVNATDLQAVHDWIQDGAKNN